ncbi:MAG: tryptophan halogenase family protein [Woeseia sp.]
MTPKKLLVVGGGSAGWMAAAYLDAALNRDRRRADIMLVESPDVPRIGVGEATVPSINHILAVIGLDEVDFLKRVDGTFKQAIRYRNWLENDNSGYYHPFNRFRESPVDRCVPRWLKSDRSLPFAATVSAQPELCDLNLAPQMLGAWDFGPPLSYAYHMNAQKFADYLCELSTARGVRHVRDHVEEVEQSETGDIAAVKTRGGERLTADLFIDCTGFRGLLIEKALGVGWVDCSQWLLCDRATTLHVPYEDHYPGYVRPYTTATALSAGWVWEIPLQDKRSLGYVHSSAFIDDEQAEREVRAFEGAHAESLDVRIVKFKVGHREKAWVKNCVAIGLAGSFIEPLESTGLYLSDLATVMLAEHFPQHGELAPLAYRFNRILANRFYEILDFINLHYCLTRRTDTAFWREVQRPERINDRLQAKLDFWRVKPPSASDFEDMHLPGQADVPLPSGGLPGDHRPPVDNGKLFGIDSYEAILYGMDFLREECDAWYGPERPPSQVAPTVARRIETAPQKLPPHDVWLQRVAGMASFAGRNGKA